MKLESRTWSLTVGKRYRFDGAEGIDVDDPFFLEVVPATDACCCDECCFNVPELKNQAVCAIFPCDGSMRWKGASVFYRKIDVDKDEAALLTRENYLRWIKRRHPLNAKWNAIIKKALAGERDFWMFDPDLRRDRRIRLSDTGVNRLEFYQFLHQADLRFIRELSVMPKVYWLDRLHRRSPVDYPIFLELSQISLWGQ